MYRIIYYDNEMSREQELNFIRMEDMLKKYLEISSLNWWDYDIRDLQVFHNEEEITQEIKDFLDKYGN